MRKLIAFFLAALLLCSCSTVEKTYKVTVEVSDIEGSWEARASYLASESDIEAAQEDESGWKTVEPAGSAFTLSGLKNGLWLIEVRCQAESGEEYYSFASVRVKGANTSVSLLFSIDESEDDSSSESSDDLVSDDSGDSEDSTSDSSGSSSESSDDVVSDDSGDSEDSTSDSGSSSESSDDVVSDDSDDGEDSTSDSSGSSSESSDDVVSDDSDDSEDSTSDSSDSSSESLDDIVSDDSDDSEDSTSDSGSSSESLDDLVPESLDDSDDSSSDSSDDSSDSSGSSSGSSSSSSSSSNKTLFVTIVTWSQKMTVSRVGSADSWLFTLTDYSAESSKTWYVNSSEVTEDGYTGSLSGVTAELSDDSLQLTVSLSSEFSDSYILVSCAEDGSYSHYLEIAITD